MSGYNLRKLIKVELQDIWLNDSSDLAPWLAREDNLAILAEDIGLEFELEAQENAVGPFRTGNCSSPLSPTPS